MAPEVPWAVAASAANSFVGGMAVCEPLDQSEHLESRPWLEPVAPSVMRTDVVRHLGGIGVGLSGDPVRRVLSHGDDVAGLGHEGNNRRVHAGRVPDGHPIHYGLVGGVLF